MANFSVVHLHDDRLDEAFPLVRMAAPEATPAQWRRFVGWLRDNDGGVLAAFADDPRPHGIAAFRSEQSLSQSRTLLVDPMVTFELNPSAPARAALCEALELIALAKGCEKLVIATPSRGYTDPAGPKAAAWADLGLAVTKVLLAKRLDSNLSIPRRARAAADEPKPFAIER